MKIIRNLPSLLKLFADVNKFKKHAALIDAAKAAGDFEEEKKWILDATSTFGPLLMEQFHVDLHVHGEENIPDEGPVVLIPNHQAYADIPVLFAVFRKFQFAFIAKKYLAKAPLIGDWMPRIRSIFIENDDPRESLRAINKGIEYLNEGFSLAICPEGTRSLGAEVAPFMKGAFKLATKPQLPIVPIAINGTYKLLEETGIVHPARVDVKVFPVIETKGMTREEIKELPEKLEEMIRNGVNELIELSK